MANFGLALAGGFAKGIDAQLTANEKREDEWDKAANKAFSENYSYYQSVQREYAKKKDQEDALTTIVGGDLDNANARKVVRTALSAGVSDPTVIQRMYEQIKSSPKSFQAPKADAPPTGGTPQTHVPLPPKPSQIAAEAPAAGSPNGIPPIASAALDPSAPPNGRCRCFCATSC